MNIYEQVDREALHAYEPDYDPREDERREARFDEWADKATECPNCGNLWDEGYHRATRTDPAYYDTPECPQCGMSPEEAQEAVRAREEECDEADED